VALEHASLSARWVRAICAARERLRLDLGGTAGVRPWPSRANFLLVEVLPEAGHLAGEVVVALAAGGVRVRYWAAEPRLRDFFRVSVGLPGENCAFVAELRRVLAREQAGSGEENPSAAREEQPLTGGGGQCWRAGRENREPVA
ncbi:MAG: histidinol dehydrogenase, partial [Bacillota bacterium]|nr:histidinol dehydrogenase [Bacillota bacterium]